jgi:tRNA 5-methylaminomethyl-2-thiouridine biosynthesis bifunctional protein
MHAHPIQPAHWQCADDGGIYAPDYGDVYASRSGAWGQASAVFIDGCELRERWSQRGCVRLLESGFGLGVNFLATWASLRESSGSARLHYVSIEKHPFTQNDLRTALEMSISAAPANSVTTLRKLADRLIAQWPPLIAGFHTLELDAQVTLTLAFGDIAEVLPRVAGHFDAFFLDGFAPDRNPEMWSATILSQLSLLCAPEARLSSWCVAGAVRRALTDAGFIVSKRPGFGGKRDVLAARWPASSAATSLPSSAIVIGAGIAGAAVARQLARRGIPVTVLERDHPASGGSGNPVGIVRPEPGGTTNPITEITAAGVTWLRRWIAHYGSSVRHDWCGVLRIARDERKRDKMSAQAGLVDDSWLREVDVATAAQLCGATPAESGFHLPQAGWVSPPALVAAMLDDPLISVLSGTEVMRVERVDADWRVHLADGTAIDAPLMVLATAFDVDLGPLRFTIGSARGQLSHLPERADHPLAMVVCRDGYISPAVDGWHTIGATVQHDDDEASPRRSDDEQNLDRLQRLLPGFTEHASSLQSGRVGWRATTQDRVPLVGKIADGLYASLAHGARGITCAPLCAEFLAAMMCDEPLPLGREWIQRLDPLRLSVE